MESRHVDTALMIAIEVARIAITVRVTPGQHPLNLLEQSSALACSSLPLQLRCDFCLAVIEHAGELIEGQLFIVIGGFGRVGLGQVGTVRYPLGEGLFVKEQFAPYLGMRNRARFDAIINGASRYL